MVTVNGDEHDDLVFLRRLTRGCLIQEGGRLLSFRFFPAPLHLIKTPTFINFSKGVKSPILFLCINDRRQ